MPESVVTELLHAGLSRSTVLAMEHWKAQEVLDLLRSAHAGEGRQRSSDLRARAAELSARAGLGSPPGGPVLGFSTQD